MKVFWWCCWRPLWGRGFPCIARQDVCSDWWMELFLCTDWFRAVSVIPGPSPGRSGHLGSSRCSRTRWSPGVRVPGQQSRSAPSWQIYCMCAVGGSGGACWPDRGAERGLRGCFSLHRVGGPTFSQDSGSQQQQPDLCWTPTRSDGPGGGRSAGVLPSQRTRWEFGPGLVADVRGDGRRSEVVFKGKQIHLEPT